MKRRKLTDEELSMLLSGAAVGLALRTAHDLDVELFSSAELFLETVMPTHNGYDFDVFLAHLHRNGYA